MRKTVVPTNVPEKPGAPEKTVAPGKAVVLDATGLETLGAVDAVARLHLLTARRGGRLVVVNAGEDLRRLVALAGLGDVLDVRSASARQPVRKPEQAEEAGVQEVGDADDPAI